MLVGNVAEVTSPKVKVRRRWNDNTVEEVPLDSLWDFHFRNDAGGVCGAFPRAFLSAHVWCDHLQQGALGHQCRQDSAPHDLVVCILPTDNPSYESLRSKAFQ